METTFLEFMKESFPEKSSNLGDEILKERFSGFLKGVLNDNGDSIE